MKTQPLDQILKQITPLPWQSTPPDQEGHYDVENQRIGALIATGAGFYGECQPSAANAAYLAHAANVLPGLVEALETAARELAARQAVNKVICERSGVPFTPCESLAKVVTALSLATNVPVNS